MFICGYFSGRTSSDDDFICVVNYNGEDVPHFEISELPRRFNSYHVSDQNGRRLFELCQINGFSLVKERNKWEAYILLAWGYGHRRLWHGILFI